MLQGNYGAFPHGAEMERCAYNVAMPIGTPVTAARAGHVVYVEERGEDARPRVRGAAREAGLNNLVVVAHENGTFAQHMHLTLDGADVEVGDEVEPGDAIGRSGATGLAGYPHLPFVVTRDGYDYPYRSVPVTFSNASPADLVLREGRCTRRYSPSTLAMRPLAFLLLAFAGVSQAQTPAPGPRAPSDLEQIEAILELCFQGHATGVRSHFERAFHPYALMFSSSDEGVLRIPLVTWWADADGQPLPDGRPADD